MYKSLVLSQTSRWLLKTAIKLQKLKTNLKNLITCPNCLKPPGTVCRWCEPIWHSTVSCWRTPWGRTPACCRRNAAPRWRWASSPVMRTRPSAASGRTHFSAYRIGPICAWECAYDPRTIRTLHHRSAASVLWWFSLDELQCLRLEFFM